MFRQELEHFVRFLGDERSGGRRDVASEQAIAVDQALAEWRIKNVEEVIRRSARLLRSPKRAIAALGAATAVAAGGAYFVDHFIPQVQPSIVEAREAGQKEEEQEIIAVRSELQKVERWDRYVELVGVIDLEQSDVDADVVIIPGIAGSFLRMNGVDNPNLFRNIYYGRDDEGRVFRLPRSTRITSYGGTLFKSEYLAFGTDRNGEIADVIENKATGRVLGFILDYATKDEDGNEVVVQIPTFISAVGELRDADDGNRIIEPDEFLEMLPGLVGRKYIGFCANGFLVGDPGTGDVFSFTVLFDGAISDEPQIETICQYENTPQFEQVDQRVLYQLPFQIDIDLKWKNYVPFVTR